MKIFLSGGCKNGKSYYAQHLAKSQNKGLMYYVACMRPVDGEDEERIKRHRDEREGWGFLTVEQHVDIEKILDISDSGGSFLLDSTTALLANEMFLLDGSVNENAADKIIEGLCQILAEIQDIVIISDYIYSDAVIYEPLTEKYRESLAKIDKYLAKHCDVVLEVVNTQIITHKGYIHEIN